MPRFDPGAAAHPDSGLFGLDPSPDEARVSILGVPFDATTSYRRGAAGGPAAILAASHQIDLFDLVTGHPFEAGITMPALSAEVVQWNDDAVRHAAPVIAAGGIEHAPELGKHVAEVDRISARLNLWVAEQTRAALDAGRLPGLIGGDHAVPFGAITELAARHPGLGILHFDAHADLRPAYEGFAHSHASIFHNVLAQTELSRLLQVGIRDLSEEERDAIEGSQGRVRAVYDTHWAEARLTGTDLRSIVRAELEHLPRDVYVSFDIDGLEPALCPNTGTPVPGGLTWSEAMLWLSELAVSDHRIVGFDLCEVAPDPARPPGEGWDEIVGARLLYRLIGFALQSQSTGGG